MANASIDGLVSGLQTSTIISQLMQIEAQPQTRLKSKVTTEQSVVTAYQAINAALKTVLDKAKGLDTETDWRVYSASSSSTSVAATASASASPGSYTFDVTSLAKPHTVLYSTAAAKTDVVAGSTVDVTVGAGAPVSVPVGDGSLQGVVDGINVRTDLGVKAGLIKVADGSFRLQLSSTSTGEATQFSVSGLTGAGTGAITSTGTDAAIQIGPDAVNDVIRSSTNTFSDVFPGVSFTVSKQEIGVTLAVGTDTASLTTGIKGLVDSMNAAFTEISKDTAYDASTKKGGALLGQLLPTRVQSALRDTVLGGTLGTLGSVGIQLDGSGKLVLDEKKLADALQADTSSVTTMVSGFAQRVVTATEKVSQAGGDIASVIEGRQALIRTLNDQIDGWDTRLSDRQAALQKQYAALETALGKLQSQGNWLSGQIASLPTSSS